MRKIIIPILLTGVFTLAGCAGETDGGLKATDPTPTSTPESTIKTVAPDAKPGDFPAFEEENYTFVYSRSCFCPLTGEVEVKVVDGKAVSGSYVKTPKKELLSFELITINDIIDEANNADAVPDFTWPKGQAYPSSISIDRIEKAIDDEVSFQITSVEVH